MKQTLLHITLITALAMFCSNIVAMVMPSIYLENHYGADVEYKTDLARVNTSSHILRNQERKELGKIGKVFFLSLKTLRSGSYFTDLPDIMRTLTKNAANNAGKHAVIIIKPSRAYQKWDLAINWESTDADLMEIDEEGINITPETLGDDYAQKAHEINGYDYTKAAQGGFINLKNELSREIDNANKQLYKKSPRKKTAWIAPDPATTQDLKNAIDRLHRSLQRYKARDNQ
jgi:hypothetical protein